LATRSRGDWGWRASWRASRAQILGPFSAACPELGFEVGGDRDQVPAQPADHPGSFADDLVAIVAQDTDLHRVGVGERHGEAVDTVTHDRQRDRACVDRVRLPRRPGDLAGLAGHRGRHPDHPLTGGDQRRFQACGDVPAVLDRPHPLLVKTGGEPQRIQRAGVGGRDRALPRQRAGLPIDRDQHVVALVGVYPNHDHVPRPFVFA
jgi:hypothetical protein